MEHFTPENRKDTSSAISSGELKWPVGTRSFWSCIFPTNDCAGDIDGDNIAGTSDLLLLLSGFGDVCE